MGEFLFFVVVFGLAIRVFGVLYEIGDRVSDRLARKPPSENGLVWVWAYLLVGMLVFAAPVLINRYQDHPQTPEQELAALIAAEEQSK